MNKRRLGGVVFVAAVVAVVVVATGPGVLETGNGSTAPEADVGPRPGDEDSLTVADLSVRNRTDGVVTLDVAVAGGFDRAHLGRSLAGLHDDPAVNVSAIELRAVRGDVATVAVATDGRSESTHVADRVVHHLSGRTPNDDRPGNTTDREHDAGDVETRGSGGVADVGSSTRAACEADPVFYQLDFVQGESIENLGGPAGTYTPDELVRFAHGSTEQPVVRASDGEFTSNRTLRRGVESGAIAVESGTATVTFSVPAGHGPVELTLASYEKPGRYWSRETESQQEFIDADTRTFGPGGPYTLRVALPGVEARACAATRSATSATPTDTPTATASPTAPARPMAMSAPDGTAGTDGNTPAETPTAATGTPTNAARTTPAEGAGTATRAGASGGAGGPATCPVAADGSGIDLELRGADGRITNDESGDEAVRVAIAGLAPGETRTETVELVNVGTATAHELDIAIANVTSGEGATPESETETDRRNGGELDEQLQFRANYRDDGGNERVDSGTTRFVDFETISDEQRYRIGGFDLPRSTVFGQRERATLELQFRFPDRPTNNEAQGDRLAFDVTARLSADAPDCPS